MKSSVGASAVVASAVAHTVDNGDPAAKIALRRYFLDKYHAGKPYTVCDACAGFGGLRRAIAKTNPPGRYVGYDRRATTAKVTVVGDSIDALSRPGLDYDVVDIDTYGEPYDHLVAALANLAPGERTIFLTIGGFQRGRAGRTGLTAAAIIGIRFSVPLPRNLRFFNQFSDQIINAALYRAVECGWEIVEAAEADSLAVNARYIGLHIRKPRDQ